MKAHLHVGHPLTRIHVEGTTVAHEATVVIEGYAGNYPILSMHLSPDVAEKLAAQLTARQRRPCAGATPDYGRR